MRLRERIGANLGRSESEDDFWEKVNWMLRRSVDTSAADLVKLREQREQWTQCSHSKLKRLRSLLSVAHDQPRRQIILDFGKQWSQILKGHLKDCGVQLAMLPEDEDEQEQRRVWDHFAGNRYDTLVISKTPPADFPQAPFQHLILMTPLQPLEEMMDAIDWALAHTTVPDVLWTHLLYVDGTPEWLGMMELAKVGFR